MLPRATPATQSRFLPISFLATPLSLWEAIARKYHINFSVICLSFPRDFELDLWVTSREQVKP